MMIAALQPRHQRWCCHRNHYYLIGREQIERSSCWRHLVSETNWRRADGRTLQLAPSRFHSALIAFRNLTTTFAAAAAAAGQFEAIPLVRSGHQ